MRQRAAGSFVRVLMARHCETEWNAVGRRQGQLDSPLTPRGVQQAEQLVAMLAHERFDMICSSPTGRARATAAVIASRRGMPVTVFDDLVEVDHGSLAGLTNAEIDEQFPGLLEERDQQKYSWRFPGGESYEDADRRARTSLRTIQETGSTAPLIVSHAMVARMLLRNLLDLDVAAALAFKLPHAAVLDVTPRGQTRWLQP